jgi:hypothetical protein
MKADTPAQRLDGFIDKYSPAIAVSARAVIARMRARLPCAIEMVYDNYNALVVGFGPSERASEAIFSIVLYPRWISLFFLQGAGLPDPDKILKGSGKVVRHVVLATAEDLGKPEIDGLVTSALQHARVPLNYSGTRRLIIKSVSEKQRPRRPSKPA